MNAQAWLARHNDLVRKAAIEQLFARTKLDHARADRLDEDARRAGEEYRRLTIEEAK